MTKYPYTLLPAGENNTIAKPLIFIRLGCKKTHKVTPTPLIALIDSGSDVCLCKEYIGTWLGINFNKSKTEDIIAVNKSCFKCFIHPLTIYFQNKIFEAPFKFSDTLPDQTPVILGQKGFFDHYKVTFDLASKEIEII